MTNRPTCRFGRPGARRTPPSRPCPRACTDSTENAGTVAQCRPVRCHRGPWEGAAVACASSPPIPQADDTCQGIERDQKRADGCATSRVNSPRASPTEKPDQGPIIAPRASAARATTSRVRLDVPDEVRNKVVADGNAAWLDELPSIVESLTRDWSLTIGVTMRGGHAAFVVEAALADGTAAVLKIGVPGT